MELGSINLVVHDLEAALDTFLKLFGTNNVSEVIRLIKLTQQDEIVDGYLLKTSPVALGIYAPRDSSGRMAASLEKHGEGIHHIELHVGQDEFERTYTRFKDEHLSVSERLTYMGKFSEAFFWLEPDGPQGVPVKFATKAYHGLKLWKNTDYLDTPGSFERVTLPKPYLQPRVNLGTVMITVKQWDQQKLIWSDMLSRPAIDVGDLSTLQEAEVDDGRGNVFIPVKYRFSAGGAINLYYAVNADATINKVMDHRQLSVMYHNICAYVTRDKVHDYWSNLERIGFAMVDPKPMLNDNSGNGNYFFFIHPLSTHGALCEVVSAYTQDAKGQNVYDWSDTETYMVSPSVNESSTEGDLDNH